MKTQDSEALAAAVRALSEATVRGLSPAAVRSPAHGTTAEDGWAAILQRGLAGSGRESDVEVLAPPADSNSRSDGQLLAAAHAVAAYWLAAAQTAVVQRVSEIVSEGGNAVSIQITHATPEGGLAAVELRHPELGPIAIEVSLSGRTLSVLATAESEHAAAAIRAGQDALARKLKEQGITLQTLDVVVLRRRARDKKSKRQES